MVSLPPRPLTSRVSNVGSAPTMVTCSLSPLMKICGLVAVDEADHVVAGGGVDRHRVGLAIAGVGVTDAQIDGDQLHVGAGEIVDHDLVGAVLQREIDALDTVEVHGDATGIGDVAGEKRMPALGRDADALVVAVGAVEHERVEALLAIDHIAAVGVSADARIPDERVVAGTEQRMVVTLAAGDDVVAVAAEEKVVAVAARDEIVAGTTVDGQVQERRQAVSSGDDVVAAIGVDDDVLESSRRRC